MPSSNKFSSDINTYLKDLKSIVKLALEEDIRSGDVNALLIKNLVGAKNAKHRVRFVFLQMKARYQSL